MQMHPWISNNHVHFLILMKAPECGTLNCNNYILSNLACGIHLQKKTFFAAFNQVKHDKISSLGMCAYGMLHPFLAVDGWMNAL